MLKSKFCPKFFSWVVWSKTNWSYMFSKWISGQISSNWLFQLNVDSDLERAETSEHCFTMQKETQLWNLYHYWANQEKPTKTVCLGKNVIFWNLSWLFQQRYIAKSWGFFHCNQCILTLYLSYQTTPYNDFNFLGFNGFFFFFFQTPRTGGKKVDHKSK